MRNKKVAVVVVMLGSAVLSAAYLLSAVPPASSAGVAAPVETVAMSELPAGAAADMVPLPAFVPQSGAAACAAVEQLQQAQSGPRVCVWSI